MVDKVEIMRKKMERTRASLAAHLEQLGDKTVQPIEDTIDNVTDTAENVADSVESLKNYLDLPKQTKKHPWAVVGGSVAVGFLAGAILNKFAGSRDNSANRESESRQSRPAAVQGIASNGQSQKHDQDEDHGWLSGVLSKFKPQLKDVKSLAIGASIGLIRDMVAKNLPENWTDEVRNIFDDATKKSGGTKVGATSSSQA